MTEPTRVADLCPSCGKGLFETNPFCHWMKPPPMSAETPRPPAVSSPEPPTGPERGTGEAGPETSAQAATLRDASTSIRTIADHMPGRHPEFVRGVRYAATLLGHTADDLTEGATP